MSESRSVIFYAKCGIGKLIKRLLGVEHDTLLFRESYSSNKMEVCQIIIPSIEPSNSIPVLRVYSVHSVTFEAI